MQSLQQANTHTDNRDNSQAGKKTGDWHLKTGERQKGLGFPHLANRPGANAVAAVTLSPAGDGIGAA